MTAPKILGIDSLTVSGAAALAHAQSPSFLGQMPAFWGRYFYAPGQINSSGHRDSHYSAAENGFLRSNGIRLLPLARQTGNVVRDSAKGEADAKLNVDAIFETIPAGYLAGTDPNALVFLDVEASHPLNPDYYAGWSATISSYSAQRSGGGVKLKPAIYAGTKSAPTWAALATALARGSLCYGALIARYYYGSPVSNGWHPDVLTPDGGITPPILAWQYWASADDAPANLNFDTSIASPYHSDALLDGLIMPPPIAAPINVEMAAR
jgi:hypothetical protein